MNKTILILVSAALLSLAGCATANNTPSGSQSPSPANSASPSPAASTGTGVSAGINTGVNVGGSTGTTASGGGKTIEQMKAYATCLNGQGANGQGIAVALSGRIQAAEIMISQGFKDAAQGQLDLAYTTGNELEAKYNIDCIK
ncbi:MAG: hypothetical protein IV090_23195 [Candidatus Sericytochromatia bacterium]|nr:hypothetical protein [Candidatus Sericytochromatia bacterium]